MTLFLDPILKAGAICMCVGICCVCGSGHAAIYWSAGIGLLKRSEALLYLCERADCQIDGVFQL